MNVDRARHDFVVHVMVLDYRVREEERLAREAHEHGRFQSERRHWERRDQAWREREEVWSEVLSLAHRPAVASNQLAA